MKKKVLLITGAVLTTVILTAAVTCIVGACRYVSNVPEIIPRETAFTVKTGTTVTPEDLADIKCEGDYSAGFRIHATNIDDTKLSDDRSSVYVGDSEGTIHVEIIARGLRSEAGEPRKVTINVVP